MGCYSEYVVWGVTASMLYGVLQRVCSMGFYSEYVVWDVTASM